jgi:hypothetical protein
LEKPPSSQTRKNFEFAPRFAISNTSPTFANRNIIRKLGASRDRAGTDLTDTPEDARETLSVHLHIFHHGESAEFVNMQT